MAHARNIGFSSTSLNEVIEEKALRSVDDDTCGKSCSIFKPCGDYCDQCSGSILNKKCIASKEMHKNNPVEESVAKGPSAPPFRPVKSYPC